MKNRLMLNSEISIDLQRLIETRLLIQSNSGGGKSWLIRRLLEQSHGQVQQIVLDLEGEFSTLREKFDYVLVGKGGDVPASVKTAGLLAQKLLEQNVSAIIDLYELPGQERKHYARLFLESMINAPKELWHNCLVVVDEAHVFCPEKGESEAAEAVNGLATRGRKRGFCAVLATQRISKLHKDSAAECNNKLIGRCGLDIDMKRGADELGFIGKEQMLSLRGLKPGEFYAFGPAISDAVQLTKVGDVQTSHPKVGSRSLVQVQPASDKIKAVLKKMVDLPQVAEKKLATEKELREEIARLKRDRHHVLPDQKMVEREIQTAIGQANKEANVRVASLTKELKKQEQILGQIAKLAGTQRREIKIQEIRLPRVPIREKIERASREHFEKLAGDETEENHQLANPERRILNAIAWMESIGNTEPEQTAIAFLAGYTYGGGAFNNPKGSLRTKGLVEYRGSRIVLTDSGRSLASIPEEALTTEELHGKVLELLPNPHQRILKPLLEIYPEDLPREGLAEKAGYAQGGAFNNPLGRLRSLGLVEYLGDKRVKAASLLFID